MGWKGLLVGVTLLLCAAPPAFADSQVVIRTDRWSENDERGYGEFLTAIGDSGCGNIDACLKGAANPFRASDPAYVAFRADCADLPYFLRFYYAWKRGLPFSYVREVSPRGRARDIRYSARGNVVEARRDVPSGVDGLAVLARLQDDISSATYRIDPQVETQDFYSPALDRSGIRPGTVIYDPNGHLAVVFRVEHDGRIRYIDAHPDNSLTRGFYDLRFVRASPGMGAGFKNWRPLQLVGARNVGGVLFGGQVMLAPNRLLPFSLVQYYGTDRQGGGKSDGGWKEGVFLLRGQKLDYYDYVRASLSGGNLSFDPLREIADMVASNCADLGYRAEAVQAALAAGLANRPQPERLPPNIYGTDGDWETYSTPSRDARLKTAFKNVRDMAERFVLMARAKDPRLAWRGQNLPAEMLMAYDAAAAGCRLSYVRSDGALVTFGYEEARQRLFRLSFDPYHCIERRWGAGTAEVASCRDGAAKRAWYEAEQRLRNQVDRTYDAAMNFSLRELERGDGGVAAPPDTDARGYLLAQARRRES